MLDLFAARVFAVETILRAGDALVRALGKTKVLRAKEAVTAIVTEADIASNEMLVAAIRTAYPSHGIISEESETHLPGAEYVWCIDPLDGTKNFASGVPLYGINVALLRESEPVVAAIYLPSLHELCVAEKGAGVWCEGKQAHCSAKEDWTGAYGLGVVKYSSEQAELHRLIAEVSGGTAWVNAVASTAVAGLWVATGRRDWYVSRGKNSWDFAAPALLVRESGAFLTNLKGEPWRVGDRGFVAANRHLHPRLAGLVSQAYGRKEF